MKKMKATASADVKVRPEIVYEKELSLLKNKWKAKSISNKHCNAMMIYIEFLLSSFLF